MLKHRIRSRSARSLGAVLGLALLASCSTGSSGFEDIAPADELYAEGLELMKGRRVLGIYTWINYGQAREPFQAIIDNYPYSEYETEAQIKIADSYFAESNYDEALSYYRGFGDLHPQHPKVPYTVLRSALCYYNQIESIDRDQTATREALKYLELLSTQYPYDEATEEGEVILHHLRTRLADNMMEVGDFYLERTQYQSAATRYRRVLDDYPGLGNDGEALFKLGLCYEKMKRIDEALRLYHVVLENFSNSRDAERAAERIAGAE